MEDRRGRRPEARNTHVRLEAAVGELPVHQRLVGHLGDQHGEQPEGRPGLYVRQAIPDDRARRKVDRPIFHGAVEQRGARFPAVTFLFGPMRAIVESVHAGPIRSQLLVEALVNTMDSLFREKPAADPGLVGHADDEVVVLVKEAKRVSYPLCKLGGLRVREVVQVGHQRSVPVYENRSSVRSAPRGGCAHRTVGGAGLLTFHLKAHETAVENHSSVLPEGMAAAWGRAINRTTGGDRPVSVLYSGGLDSSLVAWGVRDLAGVELVTVGVRDSPDLRAAREGARLLGLPWVGRTIDLLDIERILRAEEPALATVSPVSRAVLVGTALALDSANNEDVLCGQGADELFLGYAHFDHLSARDTIAQRKGDLDRLLLQDWPRSRAIATRRGRRLGSPFLDPPFLKLASGLSIDRLRSGPGRKPLLRELATALGLPPVLANRPKKAFQYGSGIARALRSSSLAP